MLMLPHNQVLVLPATALLTTDTLRTLPRTFLVPFKPSIVAIVPV